MENRRPGEGMPLKAPRPLHSRHKIVSLTTHGDIATAAARPVSQWTQQAFTALQLTVDEDIVPAGGLIDLGDLLSS